MKNLTGWKVQWELITEIAYPYRYVTALYLINFELPWKILHTVSYFKYNEPRLLDILSYYKIRKLYQYIKFIKWSPFNIDY